VTVAHAYNPSYSEAPWKPARVNSSQDPISKKKKKKPSQRRAGGVAQGRDPEFKP
jgi:hypothetical protein